MCIRDSLWTVLNVEKLQGNASERFREHELHSTVLSAITGANLEDKFSARGKCLLGLVYQALQF